MFFNDEKGYALLLTLVTVIILAIILSGSLFLINNEIHISRFQENRIKAFYLAEAGLEYAVNKITTSEWDPSEPIDTQQLSGFFAGGDLKEINISTGTNLYIITSTAESRGISVDLKIDLVKGIDDLVLNGAIHTAGDITLSGSATVTGDVFLDSGTVNTSGSSSIDGEIVTDSEFNYVLEEFPQLPEGLTLRDDFTTPWVEGEYYEISEDGEYNLIQASSNRTITIDLNGGERIIRVKNLDIQQGHIVLKNVGENGKLVLYVENTFNLEGSSTVNYEAYSETQYPENVIMYYKGTDIIDPAGSTKFYGTFYAETADIVLSGSGGLMGDIYSGGSSVIISGDSTVDSRIVFAPDAVVEVTGSGELNGSIICDTISVSGSGEVTYEGSDTDDTVLNLGGAIRYKTIWKENEGL